MYPTPSCAATSAVGSPSRRTAPMGPGLADENERRRVDFCLRGDLDRAVGPILRCVLDEDNDWLNNGRPGGNVGLAGRIAQACADEGLAAFEDLYGTPRQIATDLAGRVEVITCGF